MICIISAIMIALGFVNGAIVITLVDYVEIQKLNKKLQKEIGIRFEYDQRIDKLKSMLENERKKKEEVVARLNNLARDILPAPCSPLERSAVCCEDCDDEFDHPTSPDFH